MTVEKPLTKDIPADGQALDLPGYERAGGYQALRKAVGNMTPQQVQEEVKNSGLRGRGGAGFPTGVKWSFTPMGSDAPRPKYVIANADEMEPGTFKDRFLMEGNPHQLIEGLILAGYANQADVAYIFIRGEYKLSQERLARALAEAYSAGYLGKNILNSGYGLEMYLHVSAGRYMCGEETGLLNALEGKRANPRAKPPYPQVSGLWGKPTIVNNVETLANVPHIINHGAEWFKGLSRTKDAGTKLYGASGKVKRPGLWELPMGTPAREILEEHAGGMRDGLRFRGLLPGGASTDFLVEEHLDVPMDFTEVEKVGSRLGTGTMVDSRRSDLPGRHDFEPDSLFCPGILRLVYAVLERAQLGGTNSESDGGRRRKTRGFGEVGISDQVLGTRPHVLRAGAGRRGAFAERTEVFPGRFRAPHPRAAV